MTKQQEILLWLLLLFLKGVQTLMSALKISFPKRINNNEVILSCMPLICIWGQGLQSRSSTLFLKLELIWIPQEMWSIYIFMYLSCLIQSSLLFCLWQWMSECFRCSTCFLVLCVFQREVEDFSHGFQLKVSVCVHYLVGLSDQEQDIHFEIKQEKHLCCSHLTSTHNFCCLFVQPLPTKSLCFLLQQLMFTFSYYCWLAPICLLPGSQQATSHFLLLHFLGCYSS